VAGQAYSAYVLHFPRNSKISLAMMSGPANKKSDVATIVGYSPDQCAKGVAFVAPAPGRCVRPLGHEHAPVCISPPPLSPPSLPPQDLLLCIVLLQSGRYFLQAQSSDGFLAYSVGFNVVERAAHPNRRW
jgi:hypothetical protein